MKSIDNTTITEFSSDDNRRVEVARRDRAPHVYLLRCWWEGRATAIRGGVWRFSVEEVFGERHRRGFHSLEEIVAFIQTELQETETNPEQAEKHL
mgnify:FL=1